MNNSGMIQREDIQNKYAFWDIDGTLATYRFNDHVADSDGSNNGMSLSEIEEGIFLKRKPSLHMQTVLQQSKAKKHIVISHCQNQKEMQDKQLWLDTYYPIITERMIVYEKENKADCILKYCREHKKLS